HSQEEKEKRGRKRGCVKSRRKSGRVAHWKTHFPCNPSATRVSISPFWFEKLPKHGKRNKNPGPKSELAEYEEQGHRSEEPKLRSRNGCTHCSSSVISGTWKPVILLSWKKIHRKTGRHSKQKKNEETTTILQDSSRSTSSAV
ncbi:unnamed protein product, partial [Heterotrigona itama]